MANDDDKVQKDDEVVEETQVVNAADFHEPSFDELEDEEEDTWS